MTTSGFRAQLFGKFSLKRDGQAVRGLDSPRLQELFCYLLIYRERPHPRETLAGLLWGDTSTAQSKKNLRQALWHLQSILHSGVGIKSRPLLLIEPDWVQVDSQADLWLDIAVFETTFGEVRGIHGAELGKHSLHALEEAVQLYRGELLEGWYQDWCLYERERFQNMFLAMLDKLMTSCEAQGQYEAGIGYGERILRYDRARERTHRQLMRLRYLSGDRTGALRQYERCVNILDDELGVAPDKSTQSLFEEIQVGKIGGTALPTGGSDVPLERASYALGAIFLRLRMLLSLLARTQLEVEQELQELERGLEGKP